MLLAVKYFGDQPDRKCCSEKSDSINFLFFFGCTVWHVGSYFPDQGLNPRPLHWKHGVLTTGPPGKSQTPLIQWQLSLGKKSILSAWEIIFPIENLKRHYYLRFILSFQISATIPEKSAPTSQEVILSNQLEKSHIRPPVVCISSFENKLVTLFFSCSVWNLRTYHISNVE